MDLGVDCPLPCEREIELLKSNYIVIARFVAIMHELTCVFYTISDTEFNFVITWINKINFFQHFLASLITADLEIGWG